MDELKIMWTEVALKQRNLIFEYFNRRNDSTAYSKKINSQIKYQIQLIKSQPNIGKMIKNTDFRNVFFGNYSIIYKKNSNIIYIAAFWDNRQNPDKLKQLLGL